MRKVVLFEDEAGYWVAEVPSLPGCNTQGRTRAEAIGNVQEAIKLYLESLAEDHAPIPGDRPVEVIEV